MSGRDPVYVTRAVLPPREVFDRYIDQIYESRQMTNQGPLALRLEELLREYLGVPNFSLCTNGTTALFLALRLAGLSGKKVVTTPFTYVASVSALLWENCVPVFADIDPETLCISPESLRDCLRRNPDAAGVLAVHVFGNVCDVDAIEAICREFGVRCIYDAAHAFGATFNGRSVLDFGDYAVSSLHATKLFHTVEGGCLISHTSEDRERTELLRAFGHVGDTHISLGINAKLSELHAAMGLALFPLIEGQIAGRREVSERYDTLLQHPGISRPRRQPGLRYNYAYYPLLFDCEATLLAVKATLEREQIFPRRYFYPSLTALPYLPEASRTATCPVADKLAKRSLCLPLHAELDPTDSERIAATVLGVLESRAGNPR